MGDFRTPLWSIDRSSRQNLNREIIKLIDILNQMDLIDICRIFYPNTQEYTFFTACHRSFSKIDHISHKANLNKYKNVEIMPCILSDHHGLKLDFNNRKMRESKYSWKLNNSLLNVLCVREETGKEIKYFLEINENEGTTHQNL